MNRQKLKDLRIAANMTQVDLAVAMQVAQGTIAGWESGRITPRAAQLPKLAQLLNCTIDELFDDSE